MRRKPVSRVIAASMVAAVTATALAGPATAVEPTTGTFQVNFTDQDGSGLGGFHVSLEREGGGSYNGPTGPDGTFWAQAEPGRYRVTLSQSSPELGYFVQYVPGTDILDEAQWFDLAAGQTVVVNETIYPNGHVMGRFTDAAGNPLANIEVMASRAHPQSTRWRQTDADGFYRFDRIRAEGTWQIEFFGYEPKFFRQYAFGASYPDQAAAVTVANGQTVVVDDRKLATGSVRIVVRDAVSGQPVPHSAVSLGNGGYAEGLDGVALISEVPEGTHPIGVDANGFESLAEGQTVTAVAGQTVEVTVTLQPRSRIETTVVDAATGEPVAGVCLIVARPQAFQLPDGCGFFSDSSGRVMAETGGAGWFQVLAFPAEAPGYGAQWVADGRGSGSQLDAKLIKVEAGRAAQAPVVRLDRAGVVTGKVTNSDGSPPQWGTVSIGDFSSFAGPGTGTVHPDEEGIYTIDFLGPYRWPLRFAAQDGIQWSGGVGNRHFAKTVQVVGGQSTAYDFQFRAPVRLTMNIGGIDGECYITAHNVLSGDVVLDTWSEDCRSAAVRPIVGPQFVKFRVFYAGGYDFEHARPVFIPSGGEKTVTLNFE